MSEILKPGSTTPPREWRPWIRCHDCDEIAETEANIVDGYLLDQTGTCPLCRANLDYWRVAVQRSEEHTSELQSHSDLVCRLLLEKKKQPVTRPDGAALRPVPACPDARLADRPPQRRRRPLRLRVRQLKGHARPSTEEYRAYSTFG